MTSQQEIANRNEAAAKAKYHAVLEADRKAGVIFSAERLAAGLEHKSAVEAAAKADWDALPA